MSTLLSAIRVTALVGVAAAWAAACGSGDTSSASPPPGHCTIYYGLAGNPETSAEGGAAPARCATSPCGYQSQSGCPADGTCFPHFDDKTNTVAPACGEVGTVRAGQACDDKSLCARGLLCVEGRCAKPCCDGDSSVCAADERCVREVKASNGEFVPGLGTCATINDCDPLSTAACGSDPAWPVCRIIDHVGTVACSRAGERDLGDDCDSAHPCGAGQHCAGNESSAVAATIQTKCVRLCKFGSCGAEPACGKDEGVCVHFDRDPDGVGECTPDWKGPGVEIDGGAPVSADAATD